MPLRNSYALGVLVVAVALILSAHGVYAQKVLLAETSDKTEVAEGGAIDTYTIRLETQPASNVTVTLNFDSTQLTASSSSFTFTSANWANAQTVTVAAVDDAVEEEQLITRNISHTASHGEPVRDVVVTIMDNDYVKADVLVVESGGKTEVVEGGAGDSYTLRLSKAPATNVTVILGVDTTELTVAPTSFTFTVANWANAQTVTVSAVNDARVEGLDVSPINHTVTSVDPDFGSVFVQPVFVSIIDNDSQKAAVGVAETGGGTEVAEGAAGDTYLVALSTQPAGNVAITLSFNASQLSTSTNALTFTPTNWNISQSVTVTAVDDHRDEGSLLEAIGHTAASPTDPNYDGIYVQSVVVTILDNDKSGVRITQSGGSTSVAEGGAGDSYLVVLDTQPSAAVTVTLTVPQSQLWTDKTNLVFTSANWSNAQTVAVNAVDDQLEEGPHSAGISHTITSTDSSYAGLSVPSVLVSILDNDRYGFVVDSQYGGSVPPVGVNWFRSGTNMVASITNSPYTRGTTQYVCRGWVGTGSVPASGSTNRTGTFALTNDSTIAWLWTTNYWLDTDTNGSGSVTVSDRWCQSGSNLLITATPAPTNRFTGWSGQTNGCTINSNRITVMMDRSRQIVANFVRLCGLRVTTPHGNGQPASGLAWYDSGTVLSAALTNSPVTIGPTQYVCRGWSGVGSVSPTGTSTNTGPFAINADSSVTWLWNTNYWLDTGAGSGGTVNVGDRWLLLNSVTTVTATASSGYHFKQWSGTTDGCTLSGNRITLPMSKPRTIVASFERLPSVQILVPTTADFFMAGTNRVTLSGTASDAVAVASVWLRNDRSATNQPCTGTTSWQSGMLLLSNGINQVTVIASDAEGNLGSDTISVFYGPYGQALLDFDGNLASDFAVFDPNGGNWFIRNLAGTTLAWQNQWGWSGAQPVPGDYNGDGRADLAVFDTQGGYWYAKSLSGTVLAWRNQWGWSTARPVPGDYDGDGIWDLAVFDTQGGYWYAKSLGGTVLALRNQWGWSGAKPVPGDYDGDGFWDQCVFDTQGGYWYAKTLDGRVLAWRKQWGWSTAIPVPGDYNGDGIFDQAVFDSANGYWYIKTLAGGTLAWRVQWGWSGAKPVSGDFDGDGIYDLAVFDTNNGRWYVKSLDGRVRAWNVNWGWRGALAPSLGD